jgi:hypothetical protein
VQFAGELIRTRYAIYILSEKELQDVKDQASKCGKETGIHQTKLLFQQILEGNRDIRVGTGELTYGGLPSGSYGLESIFNNKDPKHDVWRELIRQLDNKD